MKNLLILPEYWNTNFIGACGWIRLLNPLTSKAISSHFNVEYAYSPEGAFHKPDIVIFERLWHPMEVDIVAFAQTLKGLKKQGVKIIYSLDDNLFDFPVYQKNSWYSSLHLSVLNIFLHYADVVLVSTMALKNRLSDYHQHIVVIPNAGEPVTQRPKAKQQNAKLIFGFLANTDNQKYLFEILEDLKAVLYQYKKKVTFEIVGQSNPSLPEALFKSFPVSFKKPPDASYHNYRKWIINELHWDFGIAPMLKNDFTKCKSDMKFLDFTGLGIPGVYPDFAPFENVRANNAGLMVGDDWKSALSLMIESPAKRKEILNSAMDYLINYRNLKIQIKQWKNVLNNL